MPTETPYGGAKRRTRGQDHGLEHALDRTLIQLAEAALEDAHHVSMELPVRNVNRTVGTLLGSEITRRYGGDGLPEDTIHVTLTGSAGQSLGAFLPRGITLDMVGDANDYVGKGLSGGRIIVRPDPEASFAAEEQTIAGNMIAYGATGGEIFLRGQVGERFCVRNSGCHGRRRGRRRPRLRVHDRRPRGGARPDRAEPGGRHVRRHRRTCSTSTAGRSTRTWWTCCGRPRTTWPGCKKTVQQHHDLTRSAVAASLLGDWPRRSVAFTKVMPRDYQRVLDAAKAARAAGPRRRRGDHGGRSWLTRPAFSSTTAKSRRRSPTRNGLHRLGRGLRATSTRRERNEKVRKQASRCMDCGIPFCHSGGSGCPLGNLIPEWNDLVRRGDWAAASDRLHATNNFPEFTGKLCPAPCEAGCVLSISPDSGGPVAIKRVEQTIADQSWEAGYVQPQVSEVSSGQRVAVVGSGPAGLAAAQQLTRAGHEVTVFERDDRLGGLLRYGIPEFKMEKKVLDRRLAQLRKEGTRFVTGCEVGVDLSVERPARAVRRRRAGGRRAARPRRHGDPGPRAGRRAPGDGAPGAGQQVRARATARRRSTRAASTW